MLRLRSESVRQSRQGLHMGDNTSQRVAVLARRCRVIYIKVQCNTQYPCGRIPKSVDLEPYTINRISEAASLIEMDI